MLAEVNTKSVSNNSVCYLIINERKIVGNTSQQIVNQTAVIQKLIIWPCPTNKIHKFLSFYYFLVLYVSSKWDFLLLPRSFHFLFIEDQPYYVNAWKLLCF